MIKHYSIIGIAILAMIFICASCSSSNDSGRTPGSTSVGGANIQTGLEINDDYEVIEQQVYFKPNQEFYFHFHNNMPFDSEEVIVRLIANSSEKTLAESDYEVNPDSNQLTDKIWFGGTGMYTIIAIVGEDVRATREVMIE